MVQSPTRGRRRPAVRGLAWLVVVVVLGPVGPGPSSDAAPSKARKLVVLGDAGAGPAYEAALRGARIAAETFGGDGPFEGGIEIVGVDHQGSEAGVKASPKAIKKHTPVGVVALPPRDQGAAFWKATRGVRVPWVVISALEPDAERNPGNTVILGPTPVAQGIRAADTMLAPLAARRVGVLHEDTHIGRVLGSAFLRSLSGQISLAGVKPWADDDDPSDVIRALKAFEADWLYVALTGARSERFVRALAAAEWAPACLFCDENRNESLLATGRAVLSNSVFMDGPDPELAGRWGEDLVRKLEEGGHPIELASLRAFEAVRRILLAYTKADSTKFRQVWTAFDPGTEDVGAFGALVYEPHAGIRFYPFSLWRVTRGALEPWPRGLQPVVGCGPPLGFGRPGPADVNEHRGKVGYLTYGEGDTRTIERDLFEIGLLTNGREPEIDQAVKDEILGRAIRIAHRLFRREPDGTPIPGHSWGMSFRVTPPDDDTPRNRTWLAIVAGDHEAAGGQVIGSGMVAVYSTFLKRTMYIRQKLEPPISAADRHLMDGSYRWGIDRANNRRADEIRCLIDGFASAVGMTLAHEFGHLCGCGHDTEHPTSIMNVVAGAGASWEDAVWIERHQRDVTTALGIEGR